MRVRISKYNKDQLQEIMRSNPTPRIRKQAHAILLFQKHFSLEHISQVFDEAPDTIISWFKSWKNNGIKSLTMPTIQ